MMFTCKSYTRERGVVHVVKHPNPCRLPIGVGGRYPPEFIGSLKARRAIVKEMEAMRCQDAVSVLVSEWNRYT